MIRLTLFRKASGILTKTLSLLPTGELHKDASTCAMGTGTFITLSINHIDELPAVLANIKKFECLAYGVCSVQLEGGIVSQDKARPGDITRTKEHFHYKPGCPALFMVDGDTAPGKPTRSRDEWLALLYEACPDLAKTARVWRASTSSYIYDKAGRELRGLTGQRLYVAVVDGADISRAGEALFKRLWLKGHGHIEISKAGSFLKRAPVDAAVFSPERLDFVAGAVCRDGLRQGDLTPLYVEGEFLLDTRVALPDLTPGEDAEYQHRVEAAKAAMRGEAEEARESYIDTRSDEIASSRGIPKEEARRVVEAAISEKADLYPDFLLKLDRHGWVSVGDVLADLKRYDGATLADPLEPDYNGGRNVAKFYTNKGKPVIHSFAHGGKTYFLRTGKSPEGIQEADEDDEDNDSKMMKPYIISKGAIHWLKQVKHGCVLVPLCDFTARIKECIRWDDGAETTTHLVIEGETCEGKKLPAVEVPSSAFPALTWITTHWATDAFVFAGQSIRDHLRAAIQALSGEVNKRNVYGHLGWRKIGDEWYFLHAGGGLGATDRADIEVRPDKPRMGLYHLGGHKGHSGSENIYRTEVSDPLEGVNAPAKDDHAQAKNLDPIYEKKVSEVSCPSKGSNGAGSGHGERSNRTLRVSGYKCPVKSLQLLKLSTSKSVGYVLLASAYRAPLAEAYRIDLSLFLFGKTGQGKSELTCMPLAHFGTGFDARSFPAGWEDTEADLEVASFRAKDVVFVIDDFKPTGSTDARRLQSKANRILHAGVGNQSGRGRRRANLGAMPTYYPRGVVLSSGEDLPKTRSLRGRAVVVHIETGSVDMAALSEAQKLAREGAFCADMADYIRWLAPQMDDLKSSLRGDVIKYRDAYMGAIRGKGHERAPENFAQLFIGLVYFLRWAFETGRLTAEEHNLHLAEGGRALAELLGLQVEYQRDADEAVRFINLLKAGLLSGRCHLRDIKTGGPPQNYDRFGWRREYRGECPIEVPRGEYVGHTDGTDLFLDQEAVFAVVQRMACDQNEVFAITQRTLWQHLRESGFLAAVDRRTEGKIRTKVRKNVCGVETEMMHLRGHSLEDTSSVLSASGEPPGPSNGAGLGQQDTLDTYFPYISPEVLSDVTDDVTDRKEYSGSIKL
jgi:hypothetical protein